MNIDVPPEGFSEAAKKLLDAAQELGLPATVVQTTSDGLFGMGLIVPDEVAEKAGLASENRPQEVEVPVKRGPGRPRRAVTTEETGG